MKITILFSLFFCLTTLQAEESISGREKCLQDISIEFDLSVMEMNEKLELEFEKCSIATAQEQKHFCLTKMENNRNKEMNAFRSILRLKKMACLKSWQ